MDRKGKSSIKKRNLGKLTDPILFTLLRRKLKKTLPLSKSLNTKISSVKIQSLVVSHILSKYH